MEMFIYIMIILFGLSFIIINQYLKYKKFSKPIIDKFFEITDYDRFYSSGKRKCITVKRKGTIFNTKTGKPIYDGPEIWYNYNKYTFRGNNVVKVGVVLRSDWD